MFLGLGLGLQCLGCGVQGYIVSGFTFRVTFFLGLVFKVTVFYTQGLRVTMLLELGLNVISFGFGV